MLIDAGADKEHEEALVEFLQRFFDDRPGLDRTIKLVLITHNHIDHTMALDSVVKNFKVERYIDHGMPRARVPFYAEGVTQLSPGSRVRERTLGH